MRVEKPDDKISAREPRPIEDGWFLKKYCEALLGGAFDSERSWTI